LPGVIQRQREKDEDLAVVMIDVDNFKTHNDTLGHQAGDELLRFVGDLLRGSIRPSDHAIRYGGDEFALLLLNVDKRHACIIVERIVKLFAQYAATLGETTTVSLSAGVATMKGDKCHDPQGLLAHADAALYKAKRGGKNTVAANAA